MGSRLLEKVLLYPCVSLERPGSHTHIYFLKYHIGLDLVLGWTLSDQSLVPADPAVYPNAVT